MDGETKKLNDRQRRELDDYLEQIRQWIVANNPTTTGIIQLVAENLKLIVTTSMITSRVGPEGKLYVHQWPGTEQAKKGRGTSKQVVNTLLEIVAGQQAWLQRLYIELVQFGHPIPKLVEHPQLKTLLAFAQEELAEADHREPEER